MIKKTHFYKNFEVEVRGIIPVDHYKKLIKMFNNSEAQFIKKEQQENIYCDGAPWQLRRAGDKVYLIAKGAKKYDKKRLEIEINLKEIFNFSEFIDKFKNISYWQLRRVEDKVSLTAKGGKKCDKGRLEIKINLKNSLDFYKCIDAFKYQPYCKSLEIPRTRDFYSLSEYPGIIFAIDHYQSFDSDFPLYVFEIEEITTEDHEKEVRTKLEKIANDFALRVFSDEMDIVIIGIIQRIKDAKLKIRELLTMNPQQIQEFLSSIVLKTNTDLINEFKDIQSALIRSEIKS